MNKLIYDELVFRDFAEIQVYFQERYALEAYFKIRKKIVKACDGLTGFPESGTQVKLERYKHYRFLLIGKFYIFYIYRGNVVTIKRIIHTARDYKKILTE